jgi:hypothetical protein
MGLEAPYAQAAEEAAASGRLYGSRNSAAGLGILPMLNLAG